MLENIEILYGFIGVIGFIITGCISRYCCKHNKYCLKYCLKKIKKNKIKNDISNMINDGIDMPVKEIISKVPIVGSNDKVVGFVDKQVENLVGIVIENIIDNYIPDDNINNDDNIKVENINNDENIKVNNIKVENIK